LSNCEYISLENEFYVKKFCNDGINKKVKIEQMDAIAFVREINAADIHKWNIGMWVRGCNFRYIVIAKDKRGNTNVIYLSGNKFKISNEKGNRYFISSINIENLLTKYFKLIEE
jgi:hypothetical protein